MPIVAFCQQIYLGNLSGTNACNIIIIILGSPMSYEAYGQAVSNRITYCQQRMLTLSIDWRHR